MCELKCRTTGKNLRFSKVALALPHALSKTTLALALRAREREREERRSLALGARARPSLVGT